MGDKLPVSKAMRIERFAETYSRTANAKASAIAAGYAPTSAYGAATRMLKDPVVIKLLRARFIDRDVHAEQTYRDLVELAEIAMKRAREIAEAVGEDGEGVEPRDFAIIIETAGKAVERCARAEGVIQQYTEGRVDQGRAQSLQGIVQAVYKSIGPQQRLVLAAHLENKAAEPTTRETPRVSPDGNGNGSGNGNGVH